MYHTEANSKRYSNLVLALIPNDISVLRMKILSKRGQIIYARSDSSRVVARQATGYRKSKVHMTMQLRAERGSSNDIRVRPSSCTCVPYTF
jgi:hypothetical protein